eukprot:962548_1
MDTWWNPMNYSGTYRWHIVDAILINKIVSAEYGYVVESHDALQTGQLIWKCQLYPNGLDVSKQSEGFCAVGLRLLEMPSSWKSIFCQLHIECPQMQSKMMFAQQYNTARSWRFVISSFEDWKASFGKELTFIVTISITRITLKEDNKILFQMRANEYKTKTQLQWK